MQNNNAIIKKENGIFWLTLCAWEYFDVLSHTVFIHGLGISGISVIVILFQFDIYFLVPMPVLTPIISYLPPPVSVWMQKPGSPQAIAVGGEQEACAPEALRRATPLTHGI